MAGTSKAPRTCLGCRQVLPQEALVRYVLGPDGTVHVDYRQKLPGRGTYTCPKSDCLEKACRGGQFRRAFKGRGDADCVTLKRRLADQLLGKAENLIGMARKARQIVGGSRQVLAGLDSRSNFGLILIARDMSPAIAEKLQRKAAAFGLEVVRLLDKEQLGRLTGRNERSALAVEAGPLCERLQQELNRYESIVGEF